MYYSINIILFNIFIIIIIGILIVYFINKKNLFTYKICNKKNKQQLIRILEEENLKKTKNENWNLYIPCSYNNIEQELKTLSPKNNQKIFAISGCDKIVSKKGIWEILRDKYGREGASQIMPETYVLDNDDDMILFQNNFDSNKLYILKNKLQRKRGLKLSNNLFEILNAKFYNFKIVQEFIDNTFLINKRKINLRIYVLIKCLNGKVNGYMHKKGLCIYTNKDYNKNINDKNFENKITSYNLNNSIYNKNPSTLHELKIYFDNNNLNYKLLFYNIKNIIKLTLEASKDYLCNLKNIKNVDTFQLFGIDIIFTNNMIPYLLEFNKGPSMSNSNLQQTIRRETQKDVQKDIFDLLNITNKLTNGYIQLI